MYKTKNTYIGGNKALSLTTAWLHVAPDTEEWMRQAGMPANLFTTTQLSRTLTSSKNQTTLKEWEFVASDDMQIIYFNLWKQFQEELENSFEQR